MVSAAKLNPSRAIRGGSSAGLTAILAAAAVGGGIYLVTHREIRRPIVRDDSIVQVAALARVEQETEWLQRAIRERQAILGMTYREVETAKGLPREKQLRASLPEPLRAKGGVENWIYITSSGSESSVLFGANGLVIHATDVEGKPREGNAIRQ